LSGGREGDVSDILFKEETHEYFVDGVRYPSVTEILSALIDFSRVSAYVLEEKRRLGRAVHKAIELYLKGELDHDTVDERVWPYLESFIVFAATRPLRLIDAEKIVFSRVHRVAGRLDLVWAFDDTPDELWLIDAKATYAMSPVTALQTGAYAALYEETCGVKVKRRAGLQLQPDGKVAKMFPYTNHADFRIFLNARNLYTWVINHRR
jgi:hypothetical protein